MIKKMFFLVLSLLLGITVLFMGWGSKQTQRKQLNKI